MNEQVERDCPVCQRRYNANPARLKFGRETTCGRACSYELRASKLKHSEQRQCGGCGKIIVRSPARIKSRHGAVFCSPACAYANRVRVVEKPYVIVAEYDRKSAAQKAWQTRHANPKPYPEAARQKAASRAIERIEHGDKVSKFERKAAQVFRLLGFDICTSVGVRSERGVFAAVFDIVVPVRRIIIECHGDYWHGGRWLWQSPDATQAKNLAREAGKIELARALGYEVRLLWEQQFKRDPCGACLAVVR